MSQLAQTRPRSIAEIIDASFGFYRARFGDLLVISALLIVPPVLLAPLAPDWLSFLIMLAGNLMYLAGQGAIAILVAAAIERNESITAGEVFRRLGRRAGTVILVSIASALMMMIGFVFFIVPAFIALAWTAAAVPAAAIEGLPAGAAITRSRELARGRIGHILVTMLLVWLILAALGFGFLIVFTILLTRRDDEDAGGFNWSGVLVAVAVFAGLVWAILRTASLSVAAPAIEALTVKRIGQVLMTDYIWPLQCVGLLLTAALIGALVLVMEEKR